MGGFVGDSIAVMPVPDCQYQCYSCLGILLQLCIVCLCSMHVLKASTRWLPMLLIYAVLAADADFWQGVQQLLLHASVALAAPISQPRDRLLNSHKQTASVI